MANAQIERNTGNGMKRDGAAKIRRVGERIKEYVDSRNVNALASTALSNSNSEIRKAAIKGLVTIKSTSGLGLVLKESSSVMEAKMAAYTLMAMGHSAAIAAAAQREMNENGLVASAETLVIFGKQDAALNVVDNLRTLGRDDMLAEVAMLSSNRQLSETAIAALQTLDSIGQLSTLVRQIQSALNGQESGVGIIGSAEQLERGMAAVAALEELGAKDELARHLKGTCSTEEAKQLKAAINESLGRL